MYKKCNKTAAKCFTIFTNDFVCRSSIFEQNAIIITFSALCYTAKCYTAAKYSKMVITSAAKCYNCYILLTNFVHPLKTEYQQQSYYHKTSNIGGRIVVGIPL